MVSDTGDKDENNLVGFAKSSAKFLFSPVGAMWEVVVDGNFSLQASSACCRHLGPVVIYGTGVEAVDGVFVPCGEIQN